MGLFSFIGKALGSVAKAGLGVVTGGISDKVFSALKASGAAKAAAKAAEAEQLTNQRLALAVKINPGVSGESTIIKSLRMKDGAINFGASKPRKKAKRKKAKMADRPYKAPKASGRRRTAPKGGLDLAAIGKLYRAQGSPGNWMGFIRANPIKKT